MSRKCQISNKSKQRGNRVSHANNRTLRTWEVNLHRKWLYDSETGKSVRLRVSSRLLRTIDKKGLSAALRDFGLKLEDVMA
ncbi:MAG TPA: 50S ribosomal protein L28 [Oligoflexia bacterium]|nr:50S ribosomal protein L28 [Oligoflexia bacterium]